MFSVFVTCVFSSVRVGCLGVFAAGGRGLIREVQGDGLRRGVLGADE